MRTILMLSCVTLCGSSLCAAKKPPKEVPSPTLDQYLAGIHSKVTPVSSAPSAGSLFSATGRLADGARDLRASQVYDLVTIQVIEQSSAVSSGVTNTDRKSSANSSITSLAGALKPTSALANLVNMTGETQLQGQGTTSRQSSLTTNLTAVVEDVLPNGNLVVRGDKQIFVNSEHQTVTVRGIVRPDDLSPVNSITSDRVAMLEVQVSGKGVVEDAVKRPFFLYRLLLGLLPF